MTAARTYENPTLDAIFGVLLEKQTYKNMTYLLLSMPLAVLYFVVVVPGFWLSFGLMFIVIGFPLMLAVLLLVEQFMRFERRLLRSMLGTTVEARILFYPEDRRIFARLGERLAQGRTWRGFIYIGLRLVMGMASFLIVMGLVPLSVLLLTLPLTYEYIPVQTWAGPVNKIEEAMLLSCAGAILALLSAHLINGWTALWKRIAVPLLK